MLAAVRAVARRLPGLAGLDGPPSIEGERVVVSLPTSWEWFDAWFGALHAGALPVALAPAAALGGRELMLRRVEGVVERLGAKLLVCDAALKGELARKGGRAAEVAVTPEELASAPERRGFTPPRPDPDSTAFLQLTSGSTGLPRAVRISHRAVLHHVEALDERAGAPFGMLSREVIESLVSWLPLYHDMGLVGVFYCLANGVDLWLLPPRAFLGRPRLWLENLGSRGTTLTAAPNFGYQLSAERLSGDEAAALDLSGFRAALTGAEMIRADTLEAFSERFAAAGYDRRSFRPCYGLAEGTLAVTLDDQFDYRFGGRSRRGSAFWYVDFKGVERLTKGDRFWQGIRKIYFGALSLGRWLISRGEGGLPKWIGNRFRLGRYQRRWMGFTGV